MSIYEYDREKHIRQEKQEAYAEGYAEGFIMGYAETLEKRFAGCERGEAEGTASVLHMLVDKGLISFDTVAEKSGVPVSYFLEKLDEYLADNTRVGN